MNRRKIQIWITNIFLLSLILCVSACSLASIIETTNEPQEPKRQTEDTPIQEPPIPSPIPVIWDDDGSPDGVIALLYLLKNPQVRVVAITVSCGEAHPEIFANNLTRMLARIGQSGIPVAAGRATPLEGENAFPEAWRQSTDDFWGIELGDTGEPIETNPASQLIVDIVKQSSEPVSIFLTGNHTNLAEALRIDPTIANNIFLVEVMGGAIDVPGNIASDWPDIPNEVAEWNIWVDPAAADEVFNSSLPIILVPLDATNYVIWTEEDAVSWEETGTPEGILAAEILRWMLHSWFPGGVYAWDVVAAVDMTDPDVCQHTEKHISVSTTPGNEQGQTLADENLPANTSICIYPDTSMVKDRAAEIFQTP